MATQVQLRRGTSTENDAFTGAQGELTFDTTNKRVRIHDGATAGGFELKTENSSGDTLFADGEKAIFGAGSDLQIYHDGSHSYISDQGTGNLRILGANIAISNAAGTENHIVCYDNGAVELSYDDVTKIATTSTGIDVTGTVTADGLTVDGNVGVGLTPDTWASNYKALQLGGTFNAISGPNLNHLGNAYWDTSGQFKYTTTGTASRYYQAGDQHIWYNAGSGSADTGVSFSERMKIASNGDISFYEDTGTTAKFFWDASAESLGLNKTSSLGTAKLEIKGAGNTNATNSIFVEDSGAAGVFAVRDNGEVFIKDSLGIGTSSPLVPLHITTSSLTGALFQSTSTSGSYIRFKDADTSQHLWIGSDGNNLNFYRDDTNLSMRIDSSGNVGIGTSSPSEQLHVNGQIKFSNNLKAVGSLILEADVDNAFANSYTAFQVDGSERMRITSAGSVGIGTSSPAAALQVVGSFSNQIKFGTNTSVYTDMSMGSGFTVFNSIGGDSGAFDFRDDGTSRMFIDSSGNVGIGCIPTYKFEVDSGGSVAAARLRRTTDATLRTVLLFLSSSNSNTVGSVSINNTSTSYNTSSDYRLKENVVDLTGATARLKQLAPKRFNFIADADTTVDGFIAHEVQTVVPEAITGTHNEVDADGNPVYQGIDQSKLVPLLVATIKELEARITALENA